MSPTPTHAALAARFEDLLVGLRRLVDAAALDDIAHEGMPFSQARVLLMLVEAPAPMPISQVAERLDLSVASAGRNVDQLVKSGLAERVECPEDRRVRLVSATAAGHAHASGKLAVWRGAIRGLIAPLPDDVARRLEEALDDAFAHHPMFSRKDDA